MNKEQKEYRDKLTSIFKNAWHTGQEDQMILEAAKKYAELYPTLCELDALGDKATGGTWKSEDKAFYAEGFDERGRWEKDMGEFWTKKYQDDLNFTLASANARQAIKKAVTCDG